MFKQLRFPQIILLLGVFIYCMPLYSQGPEFEWAKSLDGNDNVRSYSIAVDDSENVYTTGRFVDTAFFGNDTLISAGTRDIFISKQDAQGNFIWAKRMGSTANDYSYSIAVDDSGSVYCTGFIDGVADFGPFTLSVIGQRDAFVCKLDKQGNFVWAKQFGGNNATLIGRSIAVDNSGNIFTTGMLKGDADFDPDTNRVYSLSAYNTGAFISKLDNNGNFILAKLIGGLYGGGNVFSRSIAVDNSGNIFTTGEFFMSPDFNPSNNLADTFYLTPRRKGNANIFVCKLDTRGDFLWAKRMGGKDSIGVPSGNDRGWSIAVDSSGNAYTTGLFYLKAKFDTIILRSNRFSIFICKQDPQGNVLWAKQTTAGVANLDADHSIAVDESGSVYITGSFNNIADFGSTTLFASHLTNAFISKLNTQGNFLWAKQIGGININSNTAGRAIALGACENIYSTGHFQGRVDFDPGTNLKDTFFLKPIGPFVSGDFKSYIQKMTQPSSSVIAGSNSPLCSGEALKLKASKGSNYSWTGPNGFSSSQRNPTIPNVDNNASGTYSVITCNDTAFVKVTVKPSPKATAISNSPVCVGDTITLSSLGGDSYNWKGPNNYISTQQNPTIANADLSMSGEYIVTVSNNNGCGNANDTVHVTVDSPLPTPTIKCYTETSSNQVKFTWDSVSGADEYEVSLDGGNIWKKANGSDGLSDVESSKQKTIMVRAVDHNGVCKYGKVAQSEACNLKLIIPNVITPNDDGKNDFFVIRGLDTQTQTSVLIFNRWGRKVYEREDYQNNWDGGDLSDGSYLYIITINDKEQKVYKGNVTILNNEK